MLVAHQARSGENLEKMSVVIYYASLLCKNVSYATLLGSVASLSNAADTLASALTSRGSSLEHDPMRNDYLQQISWQHALEDPSRVKKRKQHTQVQYLQHMLVGSNKSSHALIIHSERKNISRHTSTEWSETGCAGIRVMIFLTCTQKDLTSELGNRAR